MNLLFCLLALAWQGNYKPATPIVMTHKYGEQYVINAVDRKLIKDRIVKPKRVKELKSKLKSALEREIQRPYMWDVFVASNDQLLQFYNYRDFRIGNFTYSSYYISIKYEDGTYQGIMLVNDQSVAEFNSMVVFEELNSEEKFKRYTQVNNSQIKITLNYPQSSKNLMFKSQDGLFLDYFAETTIDRKWGQQDPASGYEYQLKGRTSNHLKSGYWLERRFSADYGQSIIEDGYYVNGLRNGKWNVSPDGPAVKIKTYQKGICTRARDL